MKLDDLRKRFAREPEKPISWPKSPAGFNLGNFNGHLKDDPFCPACEPGRAEADEDKRVWPKKCGICHGGIVHAFAGGATLCDRCGALNGEVGDFPPDPAATCAHCNHKYVNHYKYEEITPNGIPGIAHACSGPNDGKVNVTGCRCTGFSLRMGPMWSEG